MHSLEEMNTSVPAFVAKLWKIVEDIETNELIFWTTEGNSFKIKNQVRFARELLPLYFKHNNMASFIRQLNMYGFHKISSIDSGGLKLDKDEMEFGHPNFIKGHPYLLEHIKRKISTKIIDDTNKVSKPDNVNRVLNEVKGLKGRQDTFDTVLNKIQRENEVLWREIACLRQKHIKQQQIVNKLIQFLVTMVQSSRGGGIGIKRHYPLMINSIAHSPSKISKTQSPSKTSTMSASSPTGPVIHEIDHADLLEDCDLDDDQLNNLQEMGLVSSPAHCCTNSSEIPTSHPDNEEILLDIKASEAQPTHIASQSNSKPKTPVLSSKNSLKPQDPQISKKSIIKTNLNSKLRKGKKNKISKPVGIKIKPVIEETEYNVDEENLSMMTDDPLANLGLIQEKEDFSILRDGENEKSDLIYVDPLELNNQNVLFNDMELNDPLMIIPSTSGISNNIPSKDMTLACTSPSTTSTTTNKSFSKVDIDSHVDMFQSELESLRDFLKNDGIDTSTLLGVGNYQQEFPFKLFNDNPLIYELPTMSGMDGENKSNGNELMTYNSEIDLNSLLRDEDIMGIEDKDDELETPTFITQSEDPLK